MIDLRSDTATRPTQAMREAIAHAVVGDEQKREDPTVNELERRGAELLGHEAAVYLPTATMANQIALRVLTEPGDELLAEENSHVLLSELGGPAVHSGLVTRGLRFDTVTLCLSKGLGCPLGALLAGPEELMLKARRGKHLFGGAMRQAGIVAAAGVYALDHHVERLAEDHARARRLAESLAAAGLPVDLEQVETNFVQLDLGPLGIPRNEALDRLRDEAGVLLSTTVHPTVVRAVTHLDVSDADIEEASEAIPRALGVLARA